MSSPAALLDLYDAQLRTAAEMDGADDVARLGPLWLGTFEGTSGFVTYAPLREGDELPDFAGLARGVLEHFATRPAVTEVEWKTRAHDVAPGLHEALVATGFAPDEPETIMLGDAALLTGEMARPPGAGLPEGAALVRVTDLDGARRVQDCYDAVFGPGPWSVAETMVRRMEKDPGYEVWAVEHDGEVVASGRLAPVAGSDFAGLWGGGARAEWRGRGLYRALLEARARSALAQGKRYLHSDSTEYSRPILERLGLHACSRTTPYVWRRVA